MRFVADDAPATSESHVDSSVPALPAVAVAAAVGAGVLKDDRTEAAGGFLTGELLLKRSIPHKLPRKRALFSPKILENNVGVLFDFVECRAYVE